MYKPSAASYCIIKSKLVIEKEYDQNGMRIVNH